MTCSNTAVWPNETPDQWPASPRAKYWPGASTQTPDGRTPLHGKQGCDDAFADFVRANTRALLRTAYLLTGSAPGAEELVQDTLVLLYPRWARVECANLPLAYVRRAMTNRFLSQWRRRPVRELVTDTFPDRPAECDLENNIVNSAEISTLLQILTGRQQAALVLRYYGGLTDSEIADAIGARAGTVRSLISRGLATLRENAKPA